MRSSRLKNFCEVCRKQCKDQNGYHCHLNSAHHQKRLRQLATNPQEHIQKYSNELENRIVQILKTKYPGEPKDIEDIYEQYSEDKHHVKFTFTRWKDLGEFVEHLRTVRNLSVVGKLPYCKVTYVVSKAGDFMKKKRDEELQKRKEKEKQAMGKQLEDRIARMRSAQAQRLRELKQKYQNEQEALQQLDLDKKDFRFDFEEKTFMPNKLFLATEQFQQPKKQSQPVIAKPKLKNFQKLLGQIQASKKDGAEAEQEQFQWIMQGITVKVLPHDIPEIFHNKKTAILNIPEPFVAEIKLGNAKINIDQNYLETVIPKIGHNVKMLRGQLRGQTGVLKQVNIQQGYANIEINDKVIEASFNSFSKLSESS